MFRPTVGQELRRCDVMMSMSHFLHVLFGCLITITSESLKETEGGKVLGQHLQWHLDQIVLAPLRKTKMYIDVDMVHLLPIGVPFSLYKTID